MSWNEVKNTDAEFLPTHDFEEADTVEGKYVGKKTDIGPNKSTKYILEMRDGEKVEVWGSTVLDNKMGNVGEGQTVKIQFLGMAQGRKSKYKDFAVFLESD